jgi:hypothetical protein
VLRSFAHNSKSFTAKDAEDAKEKKSLTAKAAEDAKEKKSFNAKDTKDAKKAINIDISKPPRPPRMFKL